MDNPVHLVEFETMLLSRYTINPRYGSSNGLLDRSAYLLLNRLRLEGPMTIRQLSDALQLDDSTLSRQTNALLRAELVERIANPESGTARKLRITTEGRDRLETVRTAHVTGMDKVLAEWTPEEVATFAAYLKRFNNSIEERSGNRWPRPADDDAATPSAEPDPNALHH